MMGDIESVVVHLAQISWVTGAIGLRAGEADSSSASVVEHTTAGPNLNFKRVTSPTRMKYKSLYLLLRNCDKGLHIF